MPTRKSESPFVIVPARVRARKRCRLLEAALARRGELASGAIRDVERRREGASRSGESGAGSRARRGRVPAAGAAGGMRVRAAVLAALLLGGCATVTTADGERLAVASDRFAAYVERVFRGQNRVATDLAFALEETPAGSPREVAFEAAEDALLSACAGLNELAAAARDGDEPRGLAALRAAREAPRCERATEDAERVITGPAPGPAET